MVLLADGREIGRTPVLSGLQLDQNYELRVRIDSARAGTTSYSNSAVAALGQFSLAVEMNGVWFYPIEVAGNLTAGRGGERVRLDLNLGEDSDGDGLPDVWEQWQLYQAGHLPDDNGIWSLHLIDGDGDFDGDGQSNRFEYIAGTFAGDATERFELVIKERSASSVRFEFFAITGKVYTIERSTDLRTWQRIPLALSPVGATTEVLQAQEVAILSVYATPLPGGAREYYRLTVR